MGTRKLLTLRSKTRLHGRLEEHNSARTARSVKGSAWQSLFVRKASPSHGKERARLAPAIFLLAHFGE
ncbi:MAG: hypothetical protein FWE47_00650 [Oscillospiraceae bacterium]|nr:hypothetical protein [Oscillospiraceae bacterium]